VAAPLPFPTLPPSSSTPLRTRRAPPDPADSAFDGGPFPTRPPPDAACIPRPSTASSGLTIPSTSPKHPPTPYAKAYAVAAPFVPVLPVRPADHNATGIT
jgi:hypothetical protein